MAKITYTNKVAINPQPSVSAENKVTDSDMNEIKTSVNTLYDNQGDLSSLSTTDKSNLVSAINENNTSIKNIGKLLWEGSFTSGSITVNGLSDYTTIIVIVGGATCIGSLAYGAGGAGVYGSYATGIYNYRFGVNGNTLTIDNINRGGSDGTKNVPVTKIYGLL